MSQPMDLHSISMTVGDDEICFRFDPTIPDAVLNAAAIEAALCDMLATHPEHFGDRRMVVDLSNMPAMSSSQLGALLAIRKALGDQHRVQLSNLRPNVREALRITRLDHLFG